MGVFIEYISTKIQNVQLVCYKYTHSFLVLSRSFAFVYTNILTNIDSTTDRKCVFSFFLQGLRKTP